MADSSHKCQLHAGAGRGEKRRPRQVGIGTCVLLICLSTYYIDSKESLLGEIHDRVIDPLLVQAEEIAKLDLPGPQRLRQVS